MEKLRIVNERDFGWEIAHAAVSRRPPISLYTMVAGTEGYTHAAKVWDLSLVREPFSVAACQTFFSVTIRNFSIAVGQVLASTPVCEGRHPLRSFIPQVHLHRSTAPPRTQHFRNLVDREPTDPLGHAP
jgi:hypothetical protein